jgi:hypothetical protein
MKTNGWELVYRDHFLEELALIQTYISQFSAIRARKLTSGIMTFTTDRIPLNPYAFAEYEVRKTPEAIYRRAIYQSNYAVIYKIDGDQLIFLDVYHTSRNK